MNKWKRLALNILITMPVKILAFVPVFAVAFCLLIMGYEEQADSLMARIFNAHF